MRGERATAQRTEDYALHDALFLATYTGYTLETMNRLHEEQYTALALRIQHVHAYLPTGQLARGLSKL